jgi:regulator of protease activity HflC (stomatin/prohibitin superfamily)
LTFPFFYCFILALQRSTALLNCSLKKDNGRRTMSDIITQPAPLEQGPEAITSSSDTLGIQVTSFLYFVLTLGAVIGAVPTVLMIAVLNKLGAPSAVFPSLLWLAAGMTYCFLAGMVKAPAAHNGVPELFGSYVNWWLAPAGISWWLPWPFGTVKRFVHVGQVSTKMNITEIEAADNVHVSAIFTQVVRVSWPLVYVRYASGPEEALGALFGRNIRWFVSAFKSTRLPKMRGLASEVMAGARNTLSLVDGIEKPEDHKGDDPYEIEFHAGEPDETDPQKKLWTVKEIAASMGFHIERAIVDDFTLPGAVVQAAERERIEEVQRRSELTEVGTLEAAMKQLRVAFPKLSDTEIMRAVQAERGKIDVVHVGGDGGDFTKGAAVQTSRKRRS